jgi:hypothetical protein
MGVTIPSYGSETWPKKNKDATRIQATEMNFLRSVKVYNKYDKVKNEDIRNNIYIYIYIQ